MIASHLDFEMPYVAKYERIRELKQQSSPGGEGELRRLTSELKRDLENLQRQLSPWQRVRLARHPMRPYALDFINGLTTDYMELSGDRMFRDDKAVVGGFAKFNGETVMVIGTQKGRDMQENVARNFGWPNPEGYRKALRLARLAERAKAPLITFIDTPGAFPGVASEERHIAEAIAENLRDFFDLSIPVISVVIGEGGSGGALGLSVCNRLLILENAYYSVITPEGCAAILWKDKAFAPQAAEQLHLTAQDLCRLAVADEIISEPAGGAHWDYQTAIDNAGQVIARHLNELSGLSVEELKSGRYEKFRRIGMIETK